MKKTFFILYAVWIATVFVSCNGTNTSHKESLELSHTSVIVVHDASVDSVTQYLLTSSAFDFHVNRPPGLVGFRNVRLGHIANPDGHKQYFIYGQFLASANNKETSFVTIKTSGYEQWIGIQASAFSKDSSIIWDDMGDLSSSLQSKLDSQSRL